MLPDKVLTDYSKMPSYPQIVKAEHKRELLKYGLITAGALAVTAAIALSAQTIIASMPSTNTYYSTSKIADLQQAQKAGNKPKIKNRLRTESEAQSSQSPITQPNNTARMRLANLSLEEIMAQKHERITYADLKKEIAPRLEVQNIEYLAYKGPDLKRIRALAEQRGYRTYEKGEKKDRRIIINTYYARGTNALVNELKKNYPRIEKKLERFSNKEEIEVYSSKQIEELVALSCIERDMPAELCLSNLLHESGNGKASISECEYSKIIRKKKMKNGKPIIKDNKPVIEKKVQYRTRIVSAAGPLMVNAGGNHAMFLREYNRKFTWDELLRNTPLAIDLGNDILKLRLDQYKRLDFALGAYNGGDKAIIDGRIVFEQSKNHARKVMRTMKEYKDAGHAKKVKDRLKQYAINLAQRPRLAQNR